MSALASSHSTAENRLLRYPDPIAGYEEITRNADVFWRSFESFRRSFGSKCTVPTIGGKPLDLHHLFVEVTSRGGLEKVVRDRRWKEVVATFNFPSTITSASFILRRYYLSLLYHFEQAYYFHRCISPISNGEPVSRNEAITSTTQNLHKAGTENSALQLSCSVTGMIDGKFDNGYLVTVNLGPDLLKGVIYHVPNVPHTSQNFST